MGHTWDQRDGYQPLFVQRQTTDTTNDLFKSLHAKTSSIAGATNYGGISTLTNENILILRCIATQAMDINNFLVFAIFAIYHAFLCNTCRIYRQTHV